MQYMLYLFLIVFTDTELTLYVFDMRGELLQCKRGEPIQLHPSYVGDISHLLQQKFRSPYLKYAYVGETKSNEVFIPLIIFDTREERQCVMFPTNAVQYDKKENSLVDVRCLAYPQNLNTISPILLAMSRCVREKSFKVFHRGIRIDTIQMLRIISKEQPCIFVQLVTPVGRRLQVNYPANHERVTSYYIVCWNTSTVGALKQQLLSVLDTHVNKAHMRLVHQTTVLDDFTGVFKIQSPQSKNACSCYDVLRAGEREKGRDLTQSHDKSPYTSRIVRRAK